MFQQFAGLIDTQKEAQNGLKEATRRLPHDSDYPESSLLRPGLDNMGDKSVFPAKRGEISEACG